MAGRHSALGTTVALAIAVTVAGCSPATSSHAALPHTPPDLSHLVVSANGLYDLSVGAPASASVLVAYGPHRCPASGGWLPHYPQTSDTSGGQLIDPFDVVTDEGRKNTPVTTIYVWSRDISTAKGIRVGSSQAQVVAAYPVAKVTHADASDLYVVKGTHGELVMEVASHNEYARGEWPPQILGTVVWMDVQPAGSDPRPLAGSNDAGPCPVKGHVPDMDDD